MLGSFCSSSAAIFDADDREYVSTAPGSPFSAVGLVSRGLLVEHRGTGTLVDQCHVLTAQHILGSTGSAMGFRANFTGALGTTHQMSSLGTVIASGELEKYGAANQQYEARSHDWVLIRLDKCLGAVLGYARLRPGPAAGDLVHLQSGGYPVGRNRQAGLTVDPSCRVSGAYTLVWFNDCAALPGNSGGPIFQLSESNGREQLEVYAIQSAAWYDLKAIPFRSDIANEATPVWVILPQIQKYLSPRGSD